MTEPGQPGQPPPGPAASPGSSTPGSSLPSDELAPTMRLIPVPPPTTPPPRYAPPAPEAEGGSTPPPPNEGERYIGKYRVKREIGRGGMGTVYLAEQPGLGREVAIKELIATADPVSMRRFLQEAQVMARTSHPNLVQVHDIDLQGPLNYIVLEYVRGRSLRDVIMQGALPPPQVFAIMHGVLQALDYAHRHSIVHRDMKPENVLISDEGQVKVADFGIARLTDDTAVGGTATKTGTTVGTPQYMSPEQVASSKVDGRSDLYSAGIVLYELVAGQPPFTATEADGPFTLMAKHVQAPPRPPSVFQPGLNPALEQVIMKSLAKRPEDRFQSGQEFDEALSRVAETMCPGWQRSLEPGADLSRMVPPPSTAPMPVTPIGMAVSQGSVSSPPVHVVYNPTPPVRIAAKRSLGCLSVFGLLLVASVSAAMLVGVLGR